VILLAEAIDRLVDAGEAFVVEAETTVTVSGLSAADTASLMSLCDALAWGIDLFDSAGSTWSLDERPDQDFAPFRLSIQKPVPAEDTLQLLSNQAFARWLQQGHRASQWHVACLSTSIVAQTRSFQAWGATPIPVHAVPAKSPRTLVREYGAARQVPDDIRPWLVQPLNEDQWAIPAVQIWAREASLALVRCLPDEIDSESGTLKFRGPPRMTLSLIAGNGTSLDLTAFNSLQVATKWVFESEREAEMRHILLGNELARSSATSDDVAVFLRDHLADALDCAQIAYQMALADTSRDTLKTLGDLRRTVTDETAKLSDLSRQLAAAVAGALATGLGLVAARVATNAPAGLILAVMIVIAIYVLQVILSGSQFIRLQRTLRSEWHQKLYRFLPESEYTKLVTVPVRRAELSFRWTAVLGGVAVSILLAVCLWTILHPSAAAILVDKPSSSSHTMKRVSPVVKQESGSRSFAAKR
jgi:hypothetical protein